MSSALYRPMVDSSRAFSYASPVEPIDGAMPASDSARCYSKSDPIDAACVARAALREPGLPEACLAGPEQDVRLLVDHRDDLPGERKRIQKRLRWHCHDLEIGLVLPLRVLRPLRVAGVSRSRPDRLAADHSSSHRARRAQALPRPHERYPRTRAT